MPDETNDRIIWAVREACTPGRPEAVANAINSVSPEDIAVYFHDRLTGEGVEPVGVGLPASPGAASGRVVLSAEAAMDAHDAGHAVILVRSETTPDDVLGMQSSQGILTIRGGLASHAAVVARGWGIPAVVGASEVHIEGDSITIGAVTVHAGDEITIDGNTGCIYLGGLGTSKTEAPAELATLLAWADKIAQGHVQVRANVDTGDDAKVARGYGAQGIGLCRTEHMFLAPDRLPIMRRFILSSDPSAEAAALADLEVAQIEDFESILEAMDELPVTVRLLDPPLHEFLPDLVDLTAREARGELSSDELIEFEAARRLHETNPMIGTRGVRLGIVRGGLYEMQVRALCTAAVKLFSRGKHPRVEVMIPLVVDAEELRLARSWVTSVLDDIGHPELASDVVTVGAMIETPRAALTAGALAMHADFFSFGTNDLTQMTYAFSRDDVESRLLPAYRAHGILSVNPFAELDEDGVGQLVRIAVDSAKAAKPSIKFGACGEHAGHPASVAFLVRLGLNSVSCSPFRVPMTRLAVAQALLDCGRVRIEDVEFDLAEPDHLQAGDGEMPSPEAVSSDDGEGADGVVDDTLVLHVLRLRGYVSPDGFVASIGVFPSGQLGPLVAAGHVRHIEGRDMYGLLPSGKERHEQLIHRLLEDAMRTRLAEDYERFLIVNRVFKQLCTDWQLRGGEANDHADVVYDQSCVDRLAGLNFEIGPIIASLTASVPRMQRYSTRLADAALRVVAGESKQFTGVMCESFHDIWMELHEDLIVMQRIDRVTEGSF